MTYPMTVAYKVAYSESSNVENISKTKKTKTCRMFAPSVIVVAESRLT